MTRISSRRNPRCLRCSPAARMLFPAISSAVFVLPSADCSLLFLALSFLFSARSRASSSPSALLCGFPADRAACPRSQGRSGRQRPEGSLERRGNLPRRKKPSASSQRTGDGAAAALRIALTDEPQPTTPQCGLSKHTLPAPLLNHCSRACRNCSRSSATPDHRYPRPRAGRTSPRRMSGCRRPHRPHGVSQTTAPTRHSWHLPVALGLDR
jgi:hypothetical protein